MTQPLTFYDRSVPPLVAGPDYQIVVQQSVTVDGETSLYTTAQRFRVSGPHLGFTGSEVISTSPPAGGQGDYSSWLPGVVLGQPGLPWIVSPHDTDSDPAPWLVLLLLTAADLKPGSLAAPGSTGAKAVPLTEYLQPTDSETIGPVLPPGTADAWEQELRVNAPSPPDPNMPTSPPVNVIDVNLSAFRAIAPQSTELPYTAHVRASDAGVFGVVTGTRFPAGAPDGMFLAHLVSIEGLTYALPDQPLPSGTWIRLLSLASWTFTSTTAGADFPAIMSALDVRPATIPVAPSGADQASQLVATALAKGATALAYLTRTGEQTACWYHGPLLPIQLAANPQPPFATAEAGLVYDPSTGLFDTSYAIAWEIGRLLTLGNARITAALLSWADDTVAAAARRIEAQRRGLPVDAQSPRRNALHAVLDAVLGTGHRASAFGPPTPPRTRRAVAARATRTRPVVRAALPTRARHVEAQRAVAAGDSTAPLPASVTEWLTGLTRLTGVPFAHLVPDARMLPAESIRFVLVDANWIGALLAGAASVAGCTGPRASVLATAVGSLPIGSAASGFLLRSTAVTAWPDLIVHGYTDPSGQTAPLAPSRLVTLSPTVLLALFDEVIARVEIGEPGQHLHFGYLGESPPTVAVRWIDTDGGHSAGQQAGDAEAQVAFRAGAYQVVDLGATIAAINTRLGAAYAPEQVPPMGSAALALQLTVGTPYQPFRTGVTRVLVGNGLAGSAVDVYVGGTLALAALPQLAAEWVIASTAPQAIAAYATTPIPPKDASARTDTALASLEAYVPSAGTPAVLVNAGALAGVSLDDSPVPTGMSRIAVVNTTTNPVTMTVDGTVTAVPPGHVWPVEVPSGGHAVSLHSGSAEWTGPASWPSAAATTLFLTGAVGPELEVIQWPP